MGNCQAAEAATVVIQLPGNKIERIYWPASAHEIMSSNPGHYVGLVVTSPTMRTENGLPLKQLKLLRADVLCSLVMFIDLSVLKSGGLGVEMKRKNSSGWLSPNPSPLSNPDNSNSITVEPEVIRLGSNGGGTSSSSRGVWRHYGDAGGGAWKPALQIIAGIGT
ncbi:hypothetical protein D5086_025341 [Populus alba]|uniref:Uncharacterized protein n=1 Tax=Populus alba TaxID=43335 RepID=A0ACC4AYX8_POPAL